MCFWLDNYFMEYEPAVIAEFSAKTLAKLHNRFRRVFMKKFSVIIEIVILSLLLHNTEVYTELYNRAPDVLPGTIPEMRDPAFWTAGMEKPDEIILSPEAIHRMNAEYQKKINKEIQETHEKCMEHNRGLTSKVRI